MKITLAQLNFIVGDFDLNLQKILKAVSSAEKAGSDLIVFSEMAVCGPHPGDLIHYASFTEACERSLQKIKEASGKIAILIGSPSYRIEKGKRKVYNSAYFFFEKQTMLITDRKKLEKGHDENFTAGSGGQYLRFKGNNFLITVGKDAESIKELPENATNDTTIAIHLVAEPFHYLKIEMEILPDSIHSFHSIYCHAVGGHTDILFPGGSVVFSDSGKALKRLPLFKESIETWVREDQFVSKAEISFFEKERTLGVFNPDINIDKIYEALIFGIREYFQKSGFQKAVLGSSGGLDSAVVVALACAALGSENVQAVLMPSPFSTAHSVDDAVELSKNLGNPYEILAIKDIYETSLATLQPFFEGLPFDVAEENLQARIRCLLLMGISNKQGSILLNTSNKSEAAVGYGTLYGDTAGGISILGDIYKSQVYALARFINREKEIIPHHILTKPPSAELRPEQIDADSLPDYALLDAILFQHIEQFKGIDEIVALGFDDSLVRQVIRMVNQNEYKRNQLCPSFRISPVPFGNGRKVPVINRFFNQ